MQTDTRRAGRITRTFVHAAIAAFGLIAILGSGGGGDSFCFDYCGGPIPPFKFVIVSVSPTKQTAQAGTTAVFTATVTNAAQPTYSWCRVQAGDTSCANITGANSATYTLTGATAADDGAAYRVTVNDPNGSASSQGVLLVSSLAPVVHQDGEFLDADWTSTAVLQPAQNGPTHAESRQAAGGNPGAFRLQVFDLPLVPSAARIDYRALTATYDPVAQGAIRSFDFSFDCSLASGSYTPTIRPLFEQAGRRYLAKSAATSACRQVPWTGLPAAEPGRAGLRSRRRAGVWHGRNLPGPFGQRRSHHARLRRGCRPHVGTAIQHDRALRVRHRQLAGNRLASLAGRVPSPAARGRSGRGPIVRTHPFSGLYRIRCGAAPSSPSRFFLSSSYS